MTIETRRVRAAMGGAACGALLLLAGCAAQGDAARHAQQSSCEQLAAQAIGAQRTLARYGGLAEDHPAAQAQGFLLWPAFAFLEAQRGSDRRYDELRARYLALARASADKSCPVSRRQPASQAGVPGVPWNSNQARHRPDRGHAARAALS